MQSFFRYLMASVLVVGFLSGCASSVTRDAADPASAAPTVSTMKFGTVPVQVKVTLDQNAQDALKDNLKFSAKKLQETLESALDARKLLAAKDDANAMQLNIEITGVRVRSNFSAVMFGFMAGSDYIDGNVSVLDPQHQPIDHFKVSTSYALGGLAGGQDEARMGWLYEKFAEKTFAELQPK
ncbi:DUF4410 domain-containing protein [Burkholderia perseverans]|uniref:DUF4410 domain-containing protein n=1 Tax=Burkholderia perseverans TaxID=2615214 RepID=UPI001FEDF8D9|nr:DUF4410 domain-containing protein [Burkholderia perseverans]